MSAEELASWDTAETELVSLSESIERIDRSQRLSAAQSADHAGDKPGDTGEDRDAAVTEDRAFDSFLRRGIEGLSGEERQVMLERRTMSTTTGSEGGFTVPAGFRAKITEKLLAFGGLLSAANLFTTDTGNAVNWPTNDDTSNKGEMIAQNAPVTSADVVFGTKTLGAFTFSSKMVKVPFELLQDSAFDLGSWLPGKLGTRIGRGLADQLAVGVGGGTAPEGLTVGATIGINGSSATGAVTSDELITLIHTVDPAYRAGGNCRFTWHDSTLAAIRKLKDSTNRYLWEPSYQAGVPSLVQGYPYLVDNSMPVMASQAVSIAFGDISAAFTVRQVLGIQAVRLAERYAEYLQVGFFGYARFDSVVDDVAAVKTLKNKT